MNLKMEAIRELLIAAFIPTLLIPLIIGAYLLVIKMSPGRVLYLTLKAYGIWIFLCLFIGFLLGFFKPWLGDLNLLILTTRLLCMVIAGIYMLAQDIEVDSERS